MFNSNQLLENEVLDGPAAFDAGEEEGEAPATLEHVISIESSGLDDLSKKANIEEIIE